MGKRRSPWLTFVSFLVYLFLYAPIIVLIVFAFNASRTNVVFTQVVNQGPCGPFYWFCVLSKNRDVLNAARNTLTIATVNTVVSTIIGTMAALALQRYAFPAKTFSEVSLYIPIVMPPPLFGVSVVAGLVVVVVPVPAAAVVVGPDALLPLSPHAAAASEIALSSTTVRTR